MHVPITDIRMQFRLLYIVSEGMRGSRDIVFPCGWKSHNSNSFQEGNHIFLIRQTVSVSGVKK